jgi:cysteine desulfurase
MNHLYLDNASTTKTDPRVVAKMLPFFEDNFGNPSGLHHHSLRAKAALDEARDQVATILNCSFEEVIFTSGGTESDNLAILGFTESNFSPERPNLITSKIEHHAVLHPFEELSKRPEFRVKFLNPSSEGIINKQILDQKLNKETLLVSIMLANNEIGSISDIQNLSKSVNNAGAIMHTDACQAAGAVELDFAKLGVGLLSLNGSKINGPKGVGVLVKRKDLKLKPLQFGGSQEYGLRPGTENIPAIVGFAESLKIAQEERAEATKKLRQLQRQIIDYALNEIPLSRLNGPKDLNQRLPNNVHLSFLNTEGESLLLFLAEQGYSVATSSACTSASLEPSHVLTGIGIPHEIAHGSLRISLSKDTSQEQIAKFLPELKEVVAKVRKMSPVNFTAKDFPQWFS